MGMGEIVAHLELLLYHLLIFGHTLQLRAKSFQHQPLAKFLGCIDMIEFFVPFGKMLYFSPLFSRPVNRRIGGSCIHNLMIVFT